MTGNFSSSPLNVAEEQEVIFYSPEYEEELLATVGLSPADPCHFLSTREIEELLPAVDCNVVDFSQLEPYPVDYVEEPRQKKQRGRPMKAESNSKMAVYSRQYRKAKKQELAVSQQRAQDLERQNAELCRYVQEVASYVHEPEKWYNRTQNWPRAASTTPTKHPF